MRDGAGKDWDQRLRDFLVLAAIVGVVIAVTYVIDSHPYVPVEQQKISALVPEFLPPRR